MRTESEVRAALDTFERTMKKSDERTSEGIHLLACISIFRWFLGEEKTEINTDYMLKEMRKLLAEPKTVMLPGQKQFRING